MWRIANYLRSRIRFKIILPFAILTLLVSAIGVYVSTNLLSVSLDERFTRQLFESASAAADSIGQREDLHLSTYRAIAFSQGIGEAVVDNDRERLQSIVFPHAVNNIIGQVHIIDKNGMQLLIIRRSPGTSTVENYNNIPGSGQIDLPIVQNVLQGVVDDKGDKHVSLSSINNEQLFLTAGPIKQGEEIVGALLIGTYARDLVRVLKQATFSEISLYNETGQLVDTTFSISGGRDTVLTLDPNTKADLLSEGKPFLQRPIFINDREYGRLWNVLLAREEPIGFYSVAAQTTFINLQGSTARNQMVIVFTVTLLLVFGIGYFTANTITRRVQHLMENAIAVAGGDFSRRTQMSSDDEIGLLAQSLDDMTESLSGYTTALQNRIDELIALYESSTAVTVKSGLDLEYILQVISTSIKGVIQNAEHVIVYLVEENEQVLIPKAPTLKIANFPTFAFTNGTSGGFQEMLESTRPKVTTLSSVTPHIVKGSFVEQHAYDSVIAPFIAGQETIGMLMLLPDRSNTAETLLNEDSERLLSTLVNQAAVAIKNAQLFQATQQAYEELRQLDDLKTKFINIAAHELRTPLGAMLGYASFVQKRVPPNLSDATRFLVASTLRMRTMVDAMLAIQRLDSGKSFLRITTLDVRSLIKKAVVDFKPIADLEKHTLTANLPDKLPTVQADPEKIGLVLSNLVANAIKFTPEGGHIEVSAKDYLKGVLVRVRDNGVGIAPEDQERIFERFYQARPDHLAGHGGMGIGLFIIKHLVELHQGQLWVESEVDKGSSFFFTLPQLDLEDLAKETLVKNVIKQDNSKKTSEPARIAELG